MKKNFMFLMFAMIFLILSGCTSLTKSQFSSPFDPGAVANAPIKADVEIGEKISGTASVTIVLKLFKFGSQSKYAVGVNYSSNSGFAGIGFDSLSAVKEAAAYDAVTRSNADIILAPSYIIEESNYLLFSKINVTVKGYKGTIKGLKSEEPVAHKKVVIVSKVEEPVASKESVVAAYADADATENLTPVSSKQNETKVTSEEAVRNLVNK